MIRTVLQILPVIILINVKLIQYKLRSLGLAPIAFDQHAPELPTFAPDNRLANVPIEKLGENDLVYPESFVLSPDGKFAFVSVGDGRIVRINDPSNADISWVTVVRTGIDDDHCGTGGPADDNDMERKCGRPLGLWLASRSSVDKNFNSDGEDAKDEDVLLVADAYRGFLMVTGITDQPVMHTLASRAESDPPDYTFKLLNAAVQVPSTGDIYITETSQIFERRRIFYAAMDGRATGRLLRYQRSSGVIEVVAENIYMPNGITVSHDQQSLLIVCGVKIIRFDLNSQRIDPKPFIEVMPGTGDNIKAMHELPSGDEVKCYFVALGGMYKRPFSLLKLVSDKVWLTSFILAVCPYRKIIDLIPKWTALAVFNEQGNLIESFTDDGTSKLDENGKKIPVEAPWISEFEPVGEYLYLSSWYNPFLARIKRSELEG